MPILQEQDLNATQRDLYSRARSAADAQNYDYAIMLLQGLLKELPEFLTGRQRLRAAEIQKQKHEGVGTMKQMANAAKITPLTMKFGKSAKENPKEAMALAEEILAIDPYNLKGNALLAEAAATLDLLEITAMAYETAFQGNPKERLIGHQLAQTYMKMGDHVRAMNAYEKLLEHHPTDGEALSGQKNASAAHASRKGGWDMAKDYRDTLKNKDEAASLEQQSKVVKSKEAMLEQIGQIHQKLEQQANPLFAKQIAALYAQMEDFKLAIDWYQYAFELGNKTDGALEKTISDLKVKLLERQIQAAQENPSSDTELKDLQGQRTEAVLENAKQRVAKYPNDYQFRFDLGEAYVNAGMYKEALPELQLGSKQPNVRLRALNLVGVAYWKRNMLDLAEKTFKSAAAETTAMDGIKKDLLYNLGQLYESMRKNKSAVDQYKQIYEVDMAYRDVAAKVEASYENPPEDEEPAAKSA
jgi:tetratricopeptide (TPR) repeat protein